MEPIEWLAGAALVVWLAKELKLVKKQPPKTPRTPSRRDTHNHDD